MNRFEQSQATTENKQQLLSSRRINLSDAYIEHINSGIETLKEIAESPLYAPNKDHIIYMNAYESATNAAYNLDLAHSQDDKGSLMLESMTITAIGGVSAEPTVYNYDSRVGTFTQKTARMKEAQPVEIDEIISRLSDDYPSNEQLQSLLDTPTDSLDTDFVIYVLENSLVDYAEQSSADKAKQSRYTNYTTSIEDTDKGLFPVDRTTELIITATAQGSHYQLDVDSPYIPSDPDTRKSINYQITNPSDSRKWGVAHCTATVRSSKNMPKKDAQKAVVTNPNDAYFEILRAIDDFSSEVPTQELL